MKKWSICRLAAILILLTQNKILAQELELIKTTRLTHYPSASAIEFYNNRLFIIGDDAASLIIVDKEHQEVDSVRLFPGNEARIHKDEKADLEASVLLNEGGKNYLLALSSLSTEKRNKILLFDLDNKQFKIQNLQLAHLQLDEINIEGAALVNGHLVLSNRANNTSRINHLVVSRFEIEKGELSKNEKIITLLLPQKKMVTGVSGLAYSNEKDVLFFTASTENTADAVSDGEIGESYIGYISGIRNKLNNKEIKADTLIQLSSLFAAKIPQKIESLAIEEEKKNELIFHLVADNDNGESTLFKMKMKWKD